jgi:hypothetical protein
MRAQEFQYFTYQLPKEGSMGFVLRGIFRELDLLTTEAKGAKSEGYLSPSNLRRKLQKSNRVDQCHRYQTFGRSAGFGPRYVKYGEGHLTALCTKARDSPANCA